MKAYYLMIIILLIILTFMLMFSQKTKEFIKNHREEVLCGAYTFMALWFSFILLRPKNFINAFKYMKTNILYVLYIVIYIGIPAYFIYTAINSYKELYKKKKEKELKENKKNHK